MQSYNEIKAWRCNGLDWVSLRRWYALIALKIDWFFCSKHGSWQDKSPLNCD